MRSSVVEQSRPATTSRWVRGIALLLLAITNRPVGAIILNSSGLATPNGTDLAAYVGAGTFYSQGFTGTRATIVNIEGGMPWLGHQAMSTIGTMPVLGGAIPDVASHATGTTGLMGATGTRNLDVGVAYGAATYGGTIATAIEGNAFGFTIQSLYANYQQAMAGFVPTVLAGGSGLPGTSLVRADVINSSWATSGSASDGTYIRAIDSLISRYGTTMVVAAGNAGPTQNTIYAPASSLNVITVGSLHTDTPAETNPNFNVISTFSSRSITNFDPGDGVQRLRYAVSLTAPGESMYIPAYGGTGSATNLYSVNASGTSYAAPTVAAGAALLTDVGYARYVTSSSRAAVDGRVIKAVLMNSADKLPGWNNAQARGSVPVETIWGVDPTLGAGRLNLTNAFRQYTGGTTGPISITGGVPQPVSPLGWNFDSVSPTETRDIYDVGQLLTGSTLTVTLAWFAGADFDAANGSGAYSFIPNLSLEVWRFLGNSGAVYARSNSTFTTVEHLSFNLPAGNFRYQLRVNYLGMDYGTLPTGSSVNYALAWQGTPIPEASSVWLVLATGVITLGRRRAAR